MMKDYGRNSFTLSNYSRVIPLTEELNLLYNTRTESLLRINYDILVAIKSSDLSPISEDEAGVLWDEGHLVNDKEQEKKSFWNDYDDLCQSAQFVSATVLVTTACNLNCMYCFQKNNKTPLNMSHTTALSVADNILSRASKDSVKYIDITFSGGEPLLNKSAIIDIAHIISCYAYKHAGLQYAFGLITNGTIYDELFFSSLCELGLTSVQVTLDGPSSVHNVRRPMKPHCDSYESILDFISRVPAPIVVNTVVDLDNAHRLSDLVQILNDIKSVSPIKLSFTPRLGVPDIVASLAENDWQVISDAISHAYMAAANNKIAISKPGMCSPCVADRNNAVVFAPDGTQHLCNNIIGTDLTVPQDEEQSHWKSLHRTLDKECFACSVAPLCFGGCRYEGLSRNKTFSDTLCNLSYLE